MEPTELSILLHRALESRLGRILQLTAREGWLEEVEAVHDVRVASRRLRTVLDLSDPASFPDHRKHRKRAKALTDALGATRELDVHGILLTGLGPELTDLTGHAVLEHVLEDLERQRTKARARMSRGIERAQVRELSGLLEFPGLPHPCGGGDPPGSLQGLLEPRLRDALADARDRVQVEDPHALHRLRIGVKKLRYAIEVLAEALPPEAGTWLARLKALQEALGNHHDWTTLEAELWSLHAQLTSRCRPALAAGILELLGIVVEHRRAAFEALPEVAAELDPARAVEDLLALPGGASA